MSPTGAATPVRDIVVVGASAGGVEAVVRVVAGLPAELHAALFVVLHMATGARSALAQILARATTLDVVVPLDGEPIRHGRIYGARPNGGGEPGDDGRRVRGADLGVRSAQGRR